MLQIQAWPRFTLFSHVSYLSVFWVLLMLLLIHRLYMCSGVAKLRLMYLFLFPGTWALKRSEPLGSLGDEGDPCNRPTFGFSTPIISPPVNRRRQDADTEDEEEKTVSVSSAWLWFMCWIVATFFLVFIIFFKSCVPYITSLTHWPY